MNFVIPLIIAVVVAIICIQFIGVYTSTVNDLSVIGGLTMLSDTGPTLAIIGAILALGAVLAVVSVIMKSRED